MIFSSVPFLYYFFPVVILLSLAVSRRQQDGRRTAGRLTNSILLLASLFFYGYGEPKYLLLMVFSILSAWALGLLVPKSRLAFLVSVAISLGLLGWFKYADFFVESFAAVTGIPAEPLGIALPIGISFYTFQILSYTIDLRRGKITPQRNLIRFAMYVSLFPQLIAGPIVVYKDVELQLDPYARNITAESLYEGARRFLLGLGKKVLLANQLGQLAELFAGLDASDRSVAFYWIYAAAFSLQIYFDFSGYSDMAIGLGRMLGFSFPENFNYPYISRSITEFWRRWHMTLGGWFREYVYIPLGGNRVSFGRWVCNLFVVWALTGLWHGAAWTFVVWGLFHGLLLLLEKRWLGRVLAKAPAFAAHAYTLLLVGISMVIFNAASLQEAGEYLLSMFGLGSVSAGSTLTWYYLRSYGLLLAAAIFGATPLPKIIAARIRERAGRTDFGKKVLEWAEPVILACLLLVVTAYLVDGSFNPFLYFRF